MLCASINLYFQEKKSLLTSKTFERTPYVLHLPLKKHNNNEITKFRNHKDPDGIENINVCMKERKPDSDIYLQRDGES